MKGYASTVMFALLAGCSQSSPTAESESPAGPAIETEKTPGQAGQNASPGVDGTPSEDQATAGVTTSLPRAKQMGPSGAPSGPKDASDEGYVRPGFVFTDDWGVTQVVTGHFTGESEFSEFTARLGIAPDGYEVNGYTDYGFVADNGISLAFAGMPSTRCSVTDPMVLGTDDASTIDTVSVSWGVTQVVDGNGDPHPRFSSNVLWTEPGAPFGVENGERVLLLLVAQPYPLIGQGTPETVRYVPIAVFPVVDDVVTQSDTTTLTLTAIAAAAEERLAANRAAYDQRLACLAPTDFPAWPGHTDLSCREACEEPLEEGQTNGDGNVD